MGLRQAVESDLALTLEGDDWGLPIRLLAPDGSIIDKKKGTDLPIMGQILYDTLIQNPDTGGEMLTRKTCFVLRRSSLERVPLPGEHWSIEYPDPPHPDEDGNYTFVKKILDGIKAPEDGKSIGFIRLYPVEAIQS